MTSFAHLSDLHFGAEEPGAVIALHDFIAGRPDLPLIFTGDMTQDGRRTEFGAAAAFLADLPNPRMVIPGNHDVPVFNPVMRAFAPWQRFRSAFKAMPEGALSIGDVLIVGVNSARRAGWSLDWSKGRVSQRQLQRACQQARQARPDMLKVFALHHPLIAQGRGAAAATVPQAGEIAHRLVHTGFGLVLSGHGHLSRKVISADVGKGLLFSAAGSALSHRLRGESQSFDLISWQAPLLSLETWRYADGEFRAASVTQFVRTDAGWSLAT